VGQSIWAKARGSTVALYFLAGIMTWPVVTAVIYWGDRLTSNLTSLGPAETGISFWAAGGYSLLLSALIMVAGWLQSARKS